MWASPGNRLGGRWEVGAFRVFGRRRRAMPPVAPTAGGGITDMEPRRTPALDGIRAVACLAVFAVHARLPGASGRGLGVDVFFALSGWLITRLLLAERERTGRIS